MWLRESSQRQTYIHIIYIVNHIQVTIYEYVQCSGVNGEYGVQPYF